MKEKTSVWIRECLQSISHRVRTKIPSTIPDILGTLSYQRAMIIKKSQNKSDNSNLEVFYFFEEFTACLVIRMHTLDTQ